MDLVVNGLYTIGVALGPLLTVFIAEKIIKRTRPKVLPVLALIVFTLLYWLVAFVLIYVFDMNFFVLLAMPVWFGVYIAGCVSLLRTSDRRRT